MKLKTDAFLVVFDKYDPQSSENNTRSNRTKGLSAVHYKASDTTRISHFSTKPFLTSNKTEHLSKKLPQYTKEYVIVYGNSVLTNVVNLDEQLYNYTQEESNTGIVLHAIDVTKRDPLIKSVDMCSGIDFLLL